jgi:hypothetical protein
MMRRKGMAPGKRTRSSRLPPVQQSSAPQAGSPQAPAAPATGAAAVTEPDRGELVGAGYGSPIPPVAELRASMEERATAADDPPTGAVDAASQEIDPDAPADPEGAASTASPAPTSRPRR